MFDNNDEYLTINDVELPSPWWVDLADMHDHYGFHEKVDLLDPEGLKQMLIFRTKFLQEELNELKSAGSAEDVVDALVDLCVVAIGTLDLYNVHSQIAWDEVHLKNMAKEVGIKPERPNPLGLPDLVKPEGWTPPSHEDNHGLLDKIDFTNFRENFTE